MKKILLYTAYDDNYSYIGDLTSANKLQYCKENGYDFFCKRKDFINLPISWDKIYTIIQLFKHHDYEYVFWTDADAFIYNPKTRVEDIFNFERLNECVLIHSGNDLNCSVSLALEKANKSLLPEKDSYFWVSSCNVNGPCLGTFLIKNCEDSIKFLEFILAQKDFYFDRCNWWDNRAFHHCLLNNQIDSSRINILPYHKINAYWNDLGSEDFIVHLPATSGQDRINLFHKLNPYK